MPFTDAFGNILSFTIKSTENGLFVITGGGDGIIRTWKFDPANARFEQIAAPLEGHFRQVTSLLLNGKYKILVFGSLGIYF